MLVMFLWGMRTRLAGWFSCIVIRGVFLTQVWAFSRTLLCRGVLLCFGPYTCVRTAFVLVFFVVFVAFALWLSASFLVC